MRTDELVNAAEHCAHRAVTCIDLADLQPVPYALQEAIWADAYFVAARRFVAVIEDREDAMEIMHAEAEARRADACGAFEGRE